MALNIPCFLEVSAWPEENEMLVYLAQALKSPNQGLNA